jgi:hypothetical protein
LAVADTRQGGSVRERLQKLAFSHEIGDIEGETAA